MRYLYKRYEGSLLWSILLFFIPIQPMLPAPRSEAMARQLAEAFFAAQPKLHSTVSSTTEIRLEIAEPRSQCSTKGTSQTTHYYYYVYNRGDQDGFVIISGDDDYPDLIGYAYEGHLSADDLPEGLARYLELCQYTMALADSNEQIDDELRSTQQTPQGLALAVAPLLGDICWDQGEPWNDKTPRHRGSRTAVGCVATAYTQVMRYWQWPDRGEGSHSYTYRYDYVDSRGEQQSVTNRLTANFDKLYDWSNMPARASMQTTSVEREALATLASDAGIAVDMIYGNDSGTYTPLVIRVLRDHFRYKKDLSMQLRKNYTPQAWSDLLKTELSNRRPIVYNGGGFGGFHCFVCDGYDERGFFHFNWGWSGRGNGYFNLNYLIPNATGLGAGGGEYSEGQGAIIGIEPDRDGSSTPLYNSWLGTVVFEAEVSGGSQITLEQASFTSRIEDAPGYQGRVAIGIVNLKSKELTPLLEQTEPFSSDLYFQQTKFTLQREMDLTPYLTEGNYILCPIHEVKDVRGQSTWRPNGILFEADQNRYAVYQISRSTSGEYIVARRYPRAFWHLELLDEGIELIASNNNQATITLKLHNDGIQSYINRVNVRGRAKNAPKGTSWRQLAYAMTSIDVGETIEHSFKLTDRKGIFAAEEIELQVSYYDVHSSLDYLQTTSYLVPVRADHQAGQEMPARAIPATPRYEISVAKMGPGVVQLSAEESNERLHLSMVPEGTKLTVEATPSKEGTILRSLTVNGVDILATKSFVVDKDALIIATFGPEGEVPPAPMLHKVTYSCTPPEGGTIQITGAEDLSKVPHGTTLSVIVTATDPYELKALTANGGNILATKSFTVTADTRVEATFVDHTSVAHQPKTALLRLYPNPARDHLAIESALPNTLVRLYSIQGVCLYEGYTDSQGSLVIALSSYPEGSYVLRVAEKSQHFIVKR